MSTLKNKLILLASLASLLVAPSFADTAVSNPWEDALLSRAFQLAFKGELTDAALIHNIESKYDRSPSMPVRIFSAYLLTYADRRVVKQKAGFYIDFVLNQKMANAVIGEDAVLRLLRMRADESFENGKFDNAIVDYLEILKTAKGSARDYATLKMGWGYMNLEKPGQAFQVWVRAVEKKMEKKGGSPSTNLLQGLGQAFAENVNRTAEDAAMLGKITFDAKQRQFVAEGIEDGVDALKSDEAVSQMAKIAALLPWYDALTATIFEKTAVAGKRACQYLAWLSEMKNTATYAYVPYGRVVESCSTWVVKSKEKEKASANLVAVVKFHAEKFQVKGSQRHFRFELFQFLSDDVRGCQEGLAWLNEGTDERARVSSPVKEMTELCVKAAAKDEPIRKQLSEQVDNSPVKYLSSENDPMVFLITNLMKVAPMRSKLVAQLLRSPDKYRPTLLPTLLAERSQAEKDLKAADSLMTAFAPNRISQAPGAAPTEKTPTPAKVAAGSGTDKKEAIWKQILGQKISALLESKNFSEALPLLDQYAPFEPNPAALSPEGVRLWTVYLLKAKDDQALRTTVPVRLEKLLTVASVDKSAEAAPVILEMGGEFKKWDRVWDVAKNLKVQKFSKLASERLWVDLFDAIVSGQLNPVGLEKVADAELKFVAELGTKVKQKQTQTALQLNPVGKSPIAQDLNFVKSVEKKRAAAMGRKKKRDLVSEATVWVQFLDRNVKGISKRAFSHPQFSKMAGSVVSEFCKEAKVQIPGLAEKTAGNKDEIAQVVSALESRLKECSDGGHS